MCDCVPFDQLKTVNIALTKLIAGFKNEFFPHKKKNKQLKCKIRQKSTREKNHKLQYAIRWEITWSEYYKLLNTTKKTLLYIMI